MANVIERKTHLIDADGKTVGRLATQIAVLLQGKHKPSYLPYQDVGDRVEVKNARKLRFTGKKFTQKVYYRHSGYLGGLKIIPLQRVFSTNPEQVLCRAVKQMLPKNRLLTPRMKRLVIHS
ncbi:50S ribosomal protein L13 [Candidatus Uhrbacteria bacterium]|nr:50S ribosomal protein L13 [Candidatus Uhrbacteria bacterium]